MPRAVPLVAIAGLVLALTACSTVDDAPPRDASASFPTDARVEAVIGPFTSAMAMAVVPIANEARLLAGLDEPSAGMDPQTRLAAWDHAVRQVLAP